MCRANITSQVILQACHPRSTYASSPHMDRFHRCAPRQPIFARSQSTGSCRYGCAVLCYSFLFLDGSVSREQQMFPRLLSDERSSFRQQDNCSHQKLRIGRTLAHTYRFSTSLAVPNNVQPTFPLPMTCHVMPTYTSSPHTSRCRHLTPRHPMFLRCSIYLVLRYGHLAISAHVVSFQAESDPLFP